MSSIALNFLANLGKVKLTKFDRSGKQKGLRVKNTSQKGATLVINYFNKFPLFSSKHLDFLSWVEATNIVLNKLHTKKNEFKGIESLKILKNEMNLKRIYFNWDHLQNFYKK